MNEESLFAAALEKQDAAERQAFLAEACGGDVALRQRVEQLLAAHGRAPGILERGPDDAARTTGPSEPALAADRVFAGRFKLRQKLGEGGMGEVWVADQIEPVQRRVALKLIRQGFDSARTLARFDQERQALALMDHPNIARVLDAGMADGRPYFVMELIKGVPITHYCDAAKLSPRERLELFIPVCQAVQHAHQKSIIHRDLKPSNILVALYDGKPVPKVIDFGVAKATGPRLTEQSIYTEVGSLIGTLEYMAPEQAELNNLDVDTRSDIYALGAVLYELLTGSVPFSRKELQAGAFTEMLRILKEVDPPKPSTKLSGSGTLLSVAAVRHMEPQKLIALIRGEIDWIVMKCLEKDRSQRYESANAFAQDIERYLHDEPVQACPPSMRYRFGKFARRHKAGLILASVAAVAVVALIALIVGSGFTFRLQQEQDRTQAALEDAQKQRARAEEFRGEAERLSSALAFQRGLALCEQGDAARGIHWFTRGLEVVPAQATDLQRDLRSNLARWRPHVHPLKLFFPVKHGDSVGVLRFRPDGKTVVSASWDGTARLWNVSTGKPTDGAPPLKHGDQVRTMALSPDGKTVVTGSWDGTARLWDADTGKPFGEPLQHKGHVNAVAFTPDGKIVATGSSDKTGRLWDAATCRPLDLPPFRHDGTVFALAFSPDGKVIVTASNDARLWDAATGKPIGVPMSHAAPIRRVAFSRDGKTVMTGSADWTARLWDAASGKPLSPPLNHQGPVSALAVSPKGKIFLTADEEGMAHFWQIDTGKPFGVAMPHQGPVRVAVFSPDGQIVVTGSWERIARAWQADTGKPFGSPLQHGAAVTAGAFSPDGKTLVTGSDSGEIRIWEIGTGMPPGLPLPHQTDLRVVVFSSDGKTIATGSGDLDSGEARLFEVATGKPLGNPLPHRGEVRAVAFSHDGKYLVTGSADKTAQVWEVATGKRAGVPLTHEGPIWAVAFSPKNMTVLTGSDDGTARLWDAETSKTIGPPLQHQGQVRAVAFSPDGNTVLTGSDDHTARLWDVTTGKPIGEILKHDYLVRTLTFSRDSKMVLTGSHDGRARLWEAKTGKLISTTGAHENEGWVLAVDISPDGKTIVTGSGENTARLWDAATGKPRSDFLVHSAPVCTVAFSPDGKTLATGSWDGTARLWETGTGKAIGNPLQHQGFVWAVAFSPDGKTIATASRDKTARLWRLPAPLEGDVELIVLWTQSLTGTELGPDGAFRVLDAATWQQRREKLMRLGGPPSP